MNEIGYEKIISDNGIKIGCIFGSSCVLFVKVGQGESLFEFDERYLRLAAEVNEKFGYTVVVSETAGDGREDYQREMDAVGELFSGNEYEIYYMGISKGGLIGLWYGADNERVRRVLAVNPPLMINFYNRSVPAIKRLTEGRVKLVFGSLDPSYPFVPYVKEYSSVQIIEGADHNFTDMTECLIKIAEDFAAL